MSTNIKVGDRVRVTTNFAKGLQGRVFEVLQVERFTVVVDYGPEGFLFFKSEVGKV